MNITLKDGRIMPIQSLYRGSAVWVNQWEPLYPNVVRTYNEVYDAAQAALESREWEMAGTTSALLPRSSDRHYLGSTLGKAAYLRHIADMLSFCEKVENVLKDRVCGDWLPGDETDTEENLPTEHELWAMLV